MITHALFLSWKAAYEASGPLALIEATSGYTNHVWGSRLWASAMTEHFGPTGMHQSWAKADGTPSDEALGLDSVSGAIERARENINACFTFAARPDHPHFSQAAKESA